MVKLKVNLRRLQTDSTSSLIFVVSFLFGGRVSSVGRALDKLRNEGTAIALQTVRPSRGSGDHVKWRSRLKVGEIMFRAVKETSALRHGEKRRV